MALCAILKAILGALLESLEVLMAPPGRLLGRQFLGPSWVVLVVAVWVFFHILGVILVLSGGLGEVLGAVDGHRGRMEEFGSPLGTIFNLLWVPERGPRRSPKRTKIDQKTVLQNDRVLERS